MSAASVPIEHNLTHLSKGIEAEQTTDMKDIAHHAQDATMWSFCQSQPATCPDHHIVGQRAKQHQHVLRIETLFVAFGQPQSLFVPFESCLDAPTTLVVEGHIGL